MSRTTAATTLVLTSLLAATTGTIAMTKKHDSFEYQRLVKEQPTMTQTYTQKCDDANRAAHIWGNIALAFTAGAAYSLYKTAQAYKKVD